MTLTISSLRGAREQQETWTQVSHPLMESCMVGFFQKHLRLVFLPARACGHPALPAGAYGHLALPAAMWGPWEPGHEPLVRSSHLLGSAAPQQGRSWEHWGLSDEQEASTAFFDHPWHNFNCWRYVPLGSVPRTEKLKDAAFFVPFSCLSRSACCIGQMYNTTAVPQAPSSSGKTWEIHTRVMLSSISP